MSIDANFLKQQFQKAIDEYNANNKTSKILYENGQYVFIVYDVLGSLTKGLEKVGVKPEITVTDDAIVMRLEKNDLIKAVLANTGGVDIKSLVKNIDFQRQPDGSYNLVAVLNVNL